MSNIPENVLIDDEDRVRLEAMGKWCIDNNGYCVKNSSSKLGKVKRLYIHRVIMNPPDNMQVDHINGNKTDNRRCNLRIVTKQQNSFNILKVKGYTWSKSRKKWEAKIMLNQKKIFLGYFALEEEAREAYLKAKEKYHIYDQANV